MVHTCFPRDACHLNPCGSERLNNLAAPVRNREAWGLGWSWSAPLRRTIFVSKVRRTHHAPRMQTPAYGRTHRPPFPSGLGESLQFPSLPHPAFQTVPDQLWLSRETYRIYLQIASAFNPSRTPGLGHQRAQLS